MKILFLMLKSRQYFKDVDFKDFSFVSQFNNKNGANKLTLCGMFLDDFKNDVEVFRPIISEKLDNEAEILNEFRQKCEEADRIVFQPPTQLNSILTKYTSVKLYNVAFEFKEKVRIIVDDAFDIWNLEKSFNLPKSFYNEWNLKRFHNDLATINSYLNNLKYCYYNTKKLIHVLYNHNIEEIKECYGDVSNTIYLANIFYKCKQFEGYSTPIKEKSDIIKYAALSPQRSLENNKKYLNYFNIKDVQFIGVKEYKNLNKPEALCEAEIFEELKTSKFILSLPIKKPSLTWERKRIIFAMLLGSILIPYGDDAKYLGEPFIIPSDILSKSDEELQNIADAQRDYFYAHLLSEEEIKNNIEMWLK